MKKLLFIISILLAVMGLYSQNLVVEGEYFWDTDPGNGNGIPLSATDGNFDSAVENLFLNGIDVSSLSIGAHSFYVRIKGADGTWSSSFQQIVYKEGALTTITRNVKVNQAEYFWDTDPGNGSATPLLVFDGTFDSAVEQVFQNSIDVSSLPLGSHTFNVRIQGEDGNWSSNFSTVVYLEGPLVEITRTIKVNQAEYFWDTDPGNGSATPLLVFDGTFDSAIEQIFKNSIDVSSLPLGSHTFNVRIKGEDGNWSSNFSTVVYLEGPLVEISRIVKVNQAEYYWDTDPGNGSATPLLVFDGTFDSAIEQVFKNDIDISSLSVGAHTFNVRIKGEDGNWSSNFSTVVYLEGVLVEITRTVKVVQAEYFWDTDPGSGNASPLLALDGQFDQAIENLFKNNIDISALSLGAHSLNLRVKGNDGTWSELFRQTIFVECSSPTPPTIAISTYTNGICEGTESVFLATATNAGSTPVYTWYLNGTPVGTNSPYFASSTLVNGDILTCDLQSNSSCASPNTASSNSLTVSLSPIVIPTVSILSSEGTSICSGSEVTFTASVTNEGITPIYQWKIDGEDVGSNSATFTTSSLNNGDLVTCELTSNATCATPSILTSNTLTMEVISIVTPSVSISGTSGPVICSGTSVTFNATPVNGGSSPFYQWKKNGANIWVNSSSYIDSGLADGDIITCEMTSSRSCLTTPSATSNSLTFSVLPIVSTSVIISSGGITTICSGTSVTFTATDVNGGATPSYDWRIDGVSQGVNNSTFTTSSLFDGDVVYCYMTSSFACSSPTSALSNQITMTVNSTALPVATIYSDAVTAICEGTTVNFNASVTNGGSDPDYQWQINGLNTGLNISTYSNSSFVNGDVVSCIITSNAACVNGISDESNLISINVNSPITPAISISSNQGTIICSGTNVTFSATVSNEGTSPSFSWFLNGMPAGANSEFYSTNTLSDGDEITCNLTSSLSCVTSSFATSNTIEMNVDASVVASVSISTGDPTEICEGTEISFTANPVNEGPSPVYQWYFNGFPVGSNSATLSYSLFSNGDDVSLSMTGSLNCASPSVSFSNEITITVHPTDNPTVTIFADPGSSVCEGSGVLFTAFHANGGSLPEYEWFLNGISTGDNSSTLELVSVNDGDEIHCVLTSNAFCVDGITANSNTVTMDVLEYVTPSVIISAVQVMPVCDGADVEVIASVTNGGSSPIYSWTINDVLVGSNSLSFLASSWNDGDQVECSIISNETCLTTTTATSNITDLTSVTVDNSVTVAANVITANQTGASYQWFDCEGMTEISGASSQSYTAEVTGDYRVAVTIGNCTMLSDCNYIVVVGMEESEAGWIKVYPNPAISVVKIEANETITSPVRIYDVAGKLVSENYLDDNGLLYISCLSPGTYIIELQVSDVTYRQRIVKTD